MNKDQGMGNNELEKLSILNKKLWKENLTSMTG
jgi:hypothetical protein